MRSRHKATNAVAKKIKKPEHGLDLDTKEEVSNDATENVDDQSSAYNEEAHMPANTYHELIHPEVMSKMQKWLNNIPDDCGPPIPPYVLETELKVKKEWMEWASSIALSWIRLLDGYEYRFRLAALEYHKVPRHFRVSSSLLHGPPIDAGILARLEQIFETNRPRRQQSFFTTWLEINDTAREIMKEVDAHKPFPDDINLLRTMLDRFKANIDGLEKPLRVLQMGLDWLEGAVARVVFRASDKGTERIKERHSREGTIFRQWIQTLPEIQCGLVESSKYTEFYVDELVEIGVEKEKYWSMLVEQGK